jgi:hypothetical protein
MQNYYQAAYSLGATIVRGLALSLGVPVSHFDGYLKEAAATLRLLHYPPQPANPEPGEKGCGEHTDFGGVTLLLTRPAACRSGTRTSAAGSTRPRARRLRRQHRRSVRALDQRPLCLHLAPGHQCLGSRTLFRALFLHGQSAAQGGMHSHLPGRGEQPRYPAVTVEQHQIECYRRTYG